MFELDLFTIMAWFVILMFGVGVLVFVKMRTPKKEILHLRPRDRRGDEFLIVDETDVGLITKKSRSGKSHRYIKAGSGWIFSIAGRMVTRFWGIEGTAYTSTIPEGKTLNLSISEYLKFIWTDTFYSTIPQDKRSALEVDMVGVTIEPVKINPTDYNLEDLTSDVINKEDDSHMLSNWVESTKGKNAAMDIYNTVIKMALGAFVMYFAIKQGYL